VYESRISHNTFIFFLLFFFVNVFVLGFVKEEEDGAVRV
jgi:hypothetical protein